MSEEREQVIGQCLELVKQVLTNLEKIGATLLLLSGKRVTLEEKMIAAYFGSMGESYAQILSCLYKHMPDSSYVPPENILPELKQLNEDVASAIDGLLKMGTFNPNFLEQYFEYDFYNSLVQKHKFQERLKGMAEALACN